MNDFQKKVFGIMKFFHNFCKDNGLTYYMLGGTMLGAIRHKGFIPWDDDADFGMPREDYEKFIMLTSTAINKDYCVESFQNGAVDFPYRFVKIYDKNTTLIENLRRPVVRGVYVDVFPIDGVDSGDGNFFKFESYVFRKINYNNTKICRLSKKRKLYKNLAIVVSRMIPPYSIDYALFSKKINAIASKYDFKKSKYVTNFFGAWQKKETMKKEVFGKPTLYEFESMLFYGPEKYDTYLRRLYGEYMLPPPQNQIGKHHSYVTFDLNQSYCKND